MKIKKSRKWEWGHFLARVGLLMLFLLLMAVVVKIERKVGVDSSPNYKDGDLVFRSNIDGGEPFLLVRVRGFDD